MIGSLRRAAPGVLRSVLGAALVFSACAVESGGGDTPSASPSTASSRRPTTTTTTAPLAAAARYRPLLGEPVPELKQTAADVVQALASYPSSADPMAEARRRLTGLPVTGDLASRAAVLLVADTEAAGDIVYPQLGGLTATSGSAMVVVRQRRRSAGQSETSVVRTIDVRLERPAGGTWTVTDLASLGGDAPVAPAPVSADAERVLSNDAIDLPDSARWDIQSGVVDAKVLDLLGELARDHRLSVTVLATGHPENVFASRMLSNHTRGRAVDIWAVDGRPVIEQREPNGALATLARSLLSKGVTELGGPWDLDGPGGASFTNTVHQDHLHLGFDASA